MPKFTVSMKRTQTVDVTVEAKSASEVRKLLADEEVRWEYFATAGDIHRNSEVKITGVKTVEPRE